MNEQGSSLSRYLHTLRRVLRAGRAPHTRRSRIPNGGAREKGVKSPLRRLLLEVSRTFLSPDASAEGSANFAFGDDAVGPNKAAPSRRNREGAAAHLPGGASLSAVRP